MISLLLVGAAATGGFFLAEKFMNAGIIGLFIGLIIGIIAAALISRFVAYTYKAGQIAMMTRAITEGELPITLLPKEKEPLNRVLPRWRRSMPLQE